MQYLIVTQMVEKWDLFASRVRVLCANEDIEGMLQRGKKYLIPATAPRPIDRRKLPKQYKDSAFAPLFRSIDEKKISLDSLRPLTAGEVAQLREQFCLRSLPLY